MTTLFFVRHGETDWNVQGRLQGRHDIPLNQRGLVQARRCGDLLREMFAARGCDAAGLDFVASPLGRTRTTMELVRHGLGLEASDYRVDPDLTEITFGTWEGSTIAELHRSDPQRIAAREQDKWSFVPPQGESYQMLTRRVGDWYDRLQRPAVVVAHGGTARALMAHLKIVPPRAAPLCDVRQGVVYLFEGGRLERYG